MTNSTTYTDKKQLAHLYQLQKTAKVYTAFDYVLVVVERIPQNGTILRMYLH